MKVIPRRVKRKIRRGMGSETLAFVSFTSMSRNSSNLTFMDDVNVVSNALISAMDAAVALAFPRASLALARSATSSLR